MNVELSYAAAEPSPADSTERKMALKYFQVNCCLQSSCQCAVRLSKPNLLIILGFCHLFIKNCYWDVSDKKSIPLFTHLAGVKKECSSPAVEVVPAILTNLQLCCMKSAGAWRACGIQHWTLIFCSLLISLTVQRGLVDAWMQSVCRVNCDFRCEFWVLIFIGL